MVFCGSRLVFHGSMSVFMVPGRFSWFFMVSGWFFMVPGGFSWFFMVPGGVFMVPGWFSWFFIVPGWFFMVFHGSSLIFHGFSQKCIARTVSWPENPV